MIKQFHTEFFQQNVRSVRENRSITVSEFVFNRIDKIIVIRTFIGSEKHHQNNVRHSIRPSQTVTALVNLECVYLQIATECKMIPFIRYATNLNMYNI